MDIHTQQSISGFIASTPQLGFNDKGQARFYAPVRAGTLRPER